MRGSRPGHAGAPARPAGALGRAPVLHRRLAALRRGPAGGPALRRQGPDTKDREQQRAPAALVRPLPAAHLRRLQVGRDGRGDHGAVRLLPLQRWHPQPSVSSVKPSNFAYVGSRATGNDAGSFLLAGPDWKGVTPPGVKSVIRSETEFAFVLYRTQLFDPADIDNVR